MAKVTNPLFSSEARGKVGGIIFNTWRGFSTVKVKKSPAQPRTARQMLIRAFCVTCSRVWATISQVNRDGWTAYATAHPDVDWTNTPKRLTGINFYTRCGVRLLDLAKSVPSTCPVVAAPAAVEALVATGAAGQISCAFTASAGTDISIDLWTQGPKSAGVLGSIVRAKHKIYGPGETTPLVIPTLTPGLYQVYARHISEVNGLASPFVTTTATVT